MTNKQKSLIAVHSSVVIFGLTALFSKLIELSALEITVLRSIFAAMIILAIFYWQKASPLLAKQSDYGMAFLLGFLLAVHWVTYFHAMQVSTIAIGVISLYTFPIITVFLEPFFNREKPRVRDISSAFLVLFGIYLLVPEFSLDNEINQGILWGVFSAVCFSLRNLIQGYHFKGNSAKHSLMYQTLAAFILLIPFSYEVIPDVTTYQWGQLIVLGIFFTALPHTLLAFSLLNLKTKTVSLIACIQVVYATLFAILLLNEQPNLATIIGGVIVISVAMYESLNTGK